jgi:large subunit ribosomal protein L4
MKLDVKTLDAGAAGSVELSPAALVDGDIRGDILQRMVKWQLAKRRAGTHKTQSRGEVTTTRKKMYKQKGTGGARHGSKNAPLFRGGGHAHNILPRDYAHALTKKFRALALRHALTAKIRASEIVVIDEAKLTAPKTGDLKKKLAKLGVIENALIIGGAELDENFALAARNIPNLDVLPNAGLNVYDMLRRRHLVLTKDAVAAINARFDAKEAA